MVSDKPRLYVGLYVRGATEGEPYHWALMLGPKEETEGAGGRRCQVKNQTDATAEKMS